MILYRRARRSAKPRRLLRNIAAQEDLLIHVRVMMRGEHQRARHVEERVRQPQHIGARGQERARFQQLRVLHGDQQIPTIMTHAMVIVTLSRRDSHA